MKEAILKSNWAHNQHQRIDKDIKSGILFKKGRKRYFILRNNTLMWYTPEEADKHGAGKLKSSITLAGCTAKEYREQPESLVITSPAFEYIFKAGSTQEMKEWIDCIQHHIKIANSASAQSFILAEKYPKELQSILLRPGFVIAKALCHVYQSDDAIANVIGYFHVHNQHLEFLYQVIETEIGNFQSETGKTVLFRGDSVATKCVRAYLKLSLLDYVKKVVGPHIIKIMESDELIEVKYIFS